MYCERCGKKNEDGRKTCHYCGAALSPADQTSSSASQIAGAKKNPSDYSRRAGSAAEELEAWQKSENRDREEAKEESPEVRHERIEEKHDEVAALEEELRQLEKGKNTKFRRTAIIACELLVMVLILVVLTTKVPKLYGAEAEGEAFETALLSGKWEEAYAHLNVSQEESMLSLDNFITVMDRKGASGFREMELVRLNQADVEGELAETLKDPEKTAVQASYQNGAGQQSDVLLLDKVGKKLLLLADWKVNPATVSVSDITILIPEGMELMLNGKATDVIPEVNSEDGTASYHFDQLFCGGWEISLLQEDRDPYQTLVELEKEHAHGTVSLINVELTPDQELQQAILQQFTEDYQAILESSLNTQDFNEVQKYFTEQAIQEGRAGNMYANACSQAYDPEKGSGILKYEMGDISAEFVSLGKSGYAKKGDLVMEVSSVMTYTYIDAGIEKTGTKTSTGLLCYHQENGQWKIQSFS